MKWSPFAIFLNGLAYASIALLIAGIAGCGVVDRAVGGLTGYSKMCVDGVSYLQFTSGASVQYDQTGKVVTCK